LKRKQQPREQGCFGYSATLEFRSSNGPMIIVVTKQILVQPAADKGYA